MKKFGPVVAALAILAAACGSGGGESAGEAASSLPATAAASPTTVVEDPTLPRTDDTAAPSGDADRPSALGAVCSAGQLPTSDTYVVAEGNGLRARQLPGDGDIITVLPEATVVDAVAEASFCGVLADGSVWWEIGTPLLATGGWVHSSFLTAAEGAVSDSDDSERSPALGTACAGDQAPVAGSYRVDASRSASGRLVARQLPGPNQVPITALADGAVVDTSDDAIDCAVLSGGVWWNVSSPLLANGGWVNSEALVAAP